MKWDLTSNEMVQTTGCVIVEAGNFGEAPQINLKEESMDVLEAEPRILTSVPQPSATDAAAFPSSGPSAQRAPPPSFMAVVVKDEPKSPVRVCSDLDQNTSPCGESVLLAASRPGHSIFFSHFTLYRSQLLCFNPVQHCGHSLRETLPS